MSESKEEQKITDNTLWFEPPYRTGYGLLYEAGYTFPEINDTEGLDYYILYIHRMKVVADQSQIYCISKRFTETGKDIILLNECNNLSNVIDAMIGNEKKLIEMGFVAAEFFKKLKLRKYQQDWCVGDKVYHQYNIKRARQQPKPIKAKIIRLIPKKYAPSLLPDVEIKVTERRKHGNVLVKGGECLGLSLSTFASGEAVKRWPMNIINLEVESARIAARAGCHYYINNYCNDLKSQLWDINIASAFYLKSERYEELQNCELHGFSSMFGQNFLRNAVLLGTNGSLKSNVYEETVAISPRSQSAFVRAGSYIDEYCMDFGVQSFAKDIGIALNYDEHNIKVKITEVQSRQNLGIEVLKKYNGSKWTLISPIELRYNRKYSIMYVHKFKYRVESN
eukprot:26005_1